jgi:hypothetical protein
MDFVALFDFKARTQHECSLKKYELVDVKYEPSNVRDSAKKPANTVVNLSDIRLYLGAWFLLWND